MSHSKTRILSLQQYSHSIQQHRTSLNINTHRIGVIGDSNGAFRGFSAHHNRGIPRNFFPTRLPVHIPGNSNCIKLIQFRFAETKLYQFDTFSGLHRNSTTLVETCLGIFATGTEILAMGTEVLKKLIQLK